MSGDTRVNRRMLLANSASTFLSRILNVTVLVWMYQYLLRRIEPVEYSVYAVVVSVMAFSSLLTVTLTSGLGRYLVDAHARKDDRLITQIVSTMAPILGGSALLATAVGCTLAAFIEHILTVAPGHVGEARLMMTLMSLLLGMQLALAPFGLGLYIRQRFVLSSSIQIGQDLLRIALLFALLRGVGPRAIWVVVASVSASMIGLIVTQVVSRRLVPALRFRLSEMRAGLARQVLSFGAWSFLGQLATLIHDSANPIILNKLATPLDVTTLHLGAMSDQHVRHLSAQATAPLLPLMTSLNAVNDDTRLRRFFLQGCRYDMWAALFVAVPLIVFAPTFVTLYVGPRFLDAATVIMLLFASHAFLFSQSFLYKVAHAKARIGAFTVLAFVTNLGTVALSLTLVGGFKLGAIGAALAACIMRAVSMLAFIPLSVRLTGVPVSTWLRETVLPGVTPALLAAIVCATLRVFVAPASWLSLGLCTAAGGLVYVLVLVGFAMQPEDRQLLRDLVVRIRSMVTPTERGTRRGLPAPVAAESDYSDR